MTKVSNDKTQIKSEKHSPEIRRERLLDAALELFSEFGFHGVAVPRIAEQAGISTGSIYNYFESKEVLINELFMIWKERLKALYVTNYPAESSTEVQFVFIWDRLHQYAEENPKAFQFIENHLHASYLSQKCLDLEEEVFEIGRYFVRGGQAAGVLREGDPQAMVAFFFGAFVQFFKDTRASRQIWSRDASQMVRDLCWSAMVKPRD